MELWIDLDPAKTIRILTVGMLELPLMNQPTGFAREETLTFSTCTGEGAGRNCELEHSVSRFEAEPPTGRILEQDEQRFTGVVTRHPVDAHGFKRAAGTVTGPPGPPDFAESELGRALVAVHRFACLRLPAEPVAVGAKWSDSCTLLFGGQVARQDVVWELTALSDDPVSGKRAELTMIGKLSVGGEGGERSGAVEGKLYFFVDAHAPHILRVRAQVPLRAGQSTDATTTLNLQFGLVAEGGVVTRTDGLPLEPATSPTASSGSSVAGAGTPATAVRASDPSLTTTTPAASPRKAPGASPTATPPTSSAGQR